MELRKFRLKKDGVIKGNHTIRRGRNAIHTRPGEVLIASKEELGSYISRFDDLGVVDSANSIRRKRNEAKAA